MSLSLPCRFRRLPPPMKTPRRSRTVGVYCALGNPRCADPGACTHAVRLRATRRPRAAKYQSLALLVASCLLSALDAPLVRVAAEPRIRALSRCETLSNFDGLRLGFWVR